MVFIGLDEAGLREAQDLRDQFARETAAKIGVDPQVVINALACNVAWPTCSPNE